MLSVYKAKYISFNSKHIEKPQKLARKVTISHAAIWMFILLLPLEVTPILILLENAAQHVHLRSGGSPQSAVRGGILMYLAIQYIAFMCASQKDT